MRVFLVLATGLLFSFAVNGQEVDKGKPDLNTIKNKMVLRPNTRDMHSTVHDNLKRMHIQKRKQHQMTVQQQKIIRKRMERIHHRNMHRQRMIHQRKIRQHAIHRRHMHRR